MPAAALHGRSPRRDSSPRPARCSSPAALHEGAQLAVPAAVVFGFGALGWNALVYVSAGERTPPELSGRSVAVAATVIFGLSALATPPLGALAHEAGWDALWLTVAGLALVGSALAARLPQARLTWQGRVDGRIAYCMFDGVETGAPRRRPAHAKREQRGDRVDPSGDHRRPAPTGSAPEGRGARARARHQPHAGPRGAAHAPRRRAGRRRAESRRRGALALGRGPRRSLPTARRARGLLHAPSGCAPDRRRHRARCARAASGSTSSSRPAPRWARSSRRISSSIRRFSRVPGAPGSRRWSVR